MRRKTYVQDINGKDLYENDRILYGVERLSSSHSTWGQKTNKNHGQFRIHGTIKFQSGRFVIIGDENEIRELKKPQGREQFKQNVWFEKTELAEANQVERLPKSRGGHCRPLSRYEILCKEITGV